MLRGNTLTLSADVFSNSTFPMDGSSCDVNTDFIGEALDDERSLKRNSCKKKLETNHLHTLFESKKDVNEKKTTNH